MLCNSHLMTVAASRKPRRHRLPPATERLFEVEPGSRILGHCHWQRVPQQHPTLVLVHGLEGSSDSSYMKGTAEKALRAGFNAIRLNQRNCGGTEHLTPSLYNSGMSGDCRAVLAELIERDCLPEIFFAGFSMGGNLVMKMAGELGADTPGPLGGVVGVAPTVELSACADALDDRRNSLYQYLFVRNLMGRFRRKARLFPQRYRSNGLPRIRSVREFDEFITAPYCGFADAEDYYDRSSAIRVVGEIRVPTLILTARDDSFVPFSVFDHPAIRSNPHITLVGPRNGGHCGFISNSPGPERYWAEARIIEFCAQHSKLLGTRGGQGSGNGAPP